MCSTPMPRDKGQNTYEGYLGNEGATVSTLYQRYTIAGWPQSQNVALAKKFIGPDGALVVFTSVPFPPDSLKEFMASYSKSGANLSASFGKIIVDLIIQHAREDSTMAKLFLDSVIDRIGNAEIQSLINSIQSLIRTFGWAEIGSSVSNEFCECPRNTTSVSIFLFSS